MESHHELVSYGKEFIKFDNSKKLRKRGIAYEDLLKITEDTETQESSTLDEDQES